MKNNKQKKPALEGAATSSSKKKKLVPVKREVVDPVKQQPPALEETLEGSFPVIEGDYGLMSNNNEDWRVWWRPEVLVDEQMSWGSVWFPLWEQDSINNAMEEDDDDGDDHDIWDLRSIKHVPQ